MDLKEAIEQYAEILTLGSDALRRLAGSKLSEPDASDLMALLDQVNDSAHRLRLLATKV